MAAAQNGKTPRNYETALSVLRNSTTVLQASEREFGIITKNQLSGWLQMCLVTRKNVLRRALVRGLKNISKFPLWRTKNKTPKQK